MCRAHGMTYQATSRSGSSTVKTTSCVKLLTFGSLLSDFALISVPQRMTELKPTLGLKLP